MENKNETPALSNYEVNQYVIEMAMRIVETGRFNLVEACAQVRRELRVDAFTGVEITPNA